MLRQRCRLCQLIAEFRVPGVLTAEGGWCTLPAEMDGTGFLELVLEDIRVRELIAPGDRVLAAVSGGADSVCLLRTLLDLAPAGGWEVFAAHFDHAMRPESKEDAGFVQHFCEALGVRLLMGRSSSLGPDSAEAAARDERLAFLRQAAKEAGCGVIATGHTADDRAETILMNLLRGAGLRGLQGIAWRSGEFVRPFLGRSREAVRRRLRQLGQEWREDATNRDARFLRNRIRHSVLPLLEREVSPCVGESLFRLAEMAAEEDAFLDAQAQELLNRLIQSGIDAADMFLDAAALRVAHPALARRAARLALERLTGGPRDVTFRMCQRVLSAARQPSPAKDIGLGVRVSSDARWLCLSRSRPVVEPEPFDLELPRMGEVTTPGGWRIRVSEPEHPGDEPLRLTFQATDTMLRARSWRPGDRMRPKGLGASKKLQDIFTDRRVPRDERRRVPLICAGDEVVWIPGVALSERAGQSDGDILVAVRPPCGVLPAWARRT